MVCEEYTHTREQQGHVRWHTFLSYDVSAIRARITYCEYLYFEFMNNSAANLPRGFHFFNNHIVHAQNVTGCHTNVIVCAAILHSNGVRSRMPHMYTAGENTPPPTYHICAIVKQLQHSITTSKYFPEAYLFFVNCVIP